MKTKIIDAYMAGLIDGEGHIVLAKKGKSGVKPTIQVNMTCEKTILAIQSHFNAGTVRPKRTPEKYKAQWVWRVYYNDARMVASRILPYLITKEDTARQLLNHIPKIKGASSTNS